MNGTGRVKSSRMRILLQQFFHMNKTLTNQLQIKCKHIVIKKANWNYGEMQRRIQNPVKHVRISKIREQLKAVSYFRKKKSILDV